MNQCKEINNGKVFFLMGLFLTIWLGVMALPAFASQSVELTWSPSSSPDVVGYNIYYGGASEDYTNELSVTNKTNVIVPGLLNGRTYYFSARAFNSSGLESPYSSQSSYAVPTAAAIFGKPIFSNNTMSVAVTGLPGSVYVIQASTDLVNWVSLETNVTPLQFTDTNEGRYRKRFYRAEYVF